MGSKSDNSKNKGSKQWALQRVIDKVKAQNLLFNIETIIDKNLYYWCHVSINSGGEMLSNLLWEVSDEILIVASEKGQGRVTFFHYKVRGYCHNFFSFTRKKKKSKIKPDTLNVSRSTYDQSWNHVRWALHIILPVRTSGQFVLEYSIDKMQKKEVLIL